MKYTIKIIGGFIFVVVISIGFYLNRSIIINDNIGTINNEKIMKNEYELIFNNEVKSNTYTYFKSKYGIDDSKSFWSESYDGETPSDYAVKCTLEKLKKLKVEQIIMKENNIINNADYKSFIKEFNEYKANREESKIVYGAENNNIYDYYKYKQNNNLIKLKEKIGKEITMTEEEMKESYENNKENLYKLAENVKISIIRIKYGVDISREEAFNRIVTAKSLLNNNVNFDDVAKEYNEGNSIIEINYNNETRRNIDENLISLKENQVTEIKDLGDRFEIAMCMERSSGGYQDFQEVKENIKSVYLDTKLEELISNKLKDVKINIDYKKLSKIIYE